MKFSPIALMTAPLALAFAGTAVQAEDIRVMSERSKIVHYDDLNLASPKGRERLMTRVKMAARDICGTRYALGLRERLIVQRCEDVAMRNANISLAGLLNGNGSQLASRGHVIVAAP